MLFKYTLALLLTFIFIPGAGHLLLGKYKKAAILIGISIFLFILIASSLVTYLDPGSLPLDFNETRKLTAKLLFEKSGELMFLNIPLLLVWSYAVADIMWSAFGYIRNSVKTK